MQTDWIGVHFPPAIWLMLILIVWGQFPPTMLVMVMGWTLLRGALSDHSALVLWELFDVLAILALVVLVIAQMNLALIFRVNLFRPLEVVMIRPYDGDMEKVTRTSHPSVVCGIAVTENRKCVMVMRFLPVMILYRMCIEVMPVIAKVTVLAYMTMMIVVMVVKVMCLHVILMMGIFLAEAVFVMAVVVFVMVQTVFAMWVVVFAMLVVMFVMLVVVFVMLMVVFVSFLCLIEMMVAMTMLVVVVSSMMTLEVIVRVQVLSE